MSAFLPPPSLALKPKRFRNVSFSIARASIETAAKPRDAAFIAAPGPTGTVCTNLFPIPLLGQYSWFLNVYRRDLCASEGPFSVQQDKSAIRLSFAPGVKPQQQDAVMFPGIATGNINVRRAVDKLNISDAYELLMFEHSASEPFFSRRNQVQKHSHVQLPDASVDAAPLYTVQCKEKTYEIRQLFASGGALPRNPSKFEYFAMNLNPILPFTAYSCFVCVWKQFERACPVSIDKIDGRIYLRFFDALKISDDTDGLIATARYAVKVFFGAVTDTIVAEQHRILKKQLAESNRVVVSDNDFKLVVDNSPRVLTPNRRNEIWVEID